MKKGARNRNTDRGITLSVFSIANRKKLKYAFLCSCFLSLMISLLFVYVDTQSTLRKSCANVAEGFISIMHDYKHSFRLMEKLLQQEIRVAESADAIEAFLKEEDANLLSIEGSDYDGVYMYYQGRYLYSWSTPQSVCVSSGYDATKRPWYIGAKAAGGEVFFSVPYPSYANDYMLATISRLQPDGDTVIAYDIKLGQINEYVDKLDLFDGALTLICDKDGNIIGSTEHLYCGGNYMLSEDALQANVAAAQQELPHAADEMATDKAKRKVESAQALQKFGMSQRAFLSRLMKNSGRLCLRPNGFTLGFAYGNDSYTCFVLTPVAKLLPRLGIIWAGLSFLFVLASILVIRIVGRSHQVLADALTGLNNRRAFYKYCASHIAHHVDADFCIIMLDLNDFKQVNDKFGHMVGDRALLDTADALKQACMESPGRFFLCRYGGDEFLLAGTGCSPDDIAQTEACIRANIENKNRTCNNPYVLGASIGIACGKCADEAGIERLLRLADDAMYAEKTGVK